MQRILLSIERLSLIVVAGLFVLAMSLAMASTQDLPAPATTMLEPSHPRSLSFKQLVVSEMPASYQPLRDLIAGTGSPACFFAHDRSMQDGRERYVCLTRHPAKVISARHESVMRQQGWFRYSAPGRPHTTRYYAYYYSLYQARGLEVDHLQAYYDRQLLWPVVTASVSTFDSPLWFPGFSGTMVSLSLYD